MGTGEVSLPRILAPIVIMEGIPILEVLVPENPFLISGTKMLISRRVVPIPVTPALFLFSSLVTRDTVLSTGPRHDL